MVAFIQFSIAGLVFRSVGVGFLGFTIVHFASLLLGAFTYGMGLGGGWAVQPCEGPACFNLQLLYMVTACYAVGLSLFHRLIRRAIKRPATPTLTSWQHETQNYRLPDNSKPSDTPGPQSPDTTQPPDIPDSRPPAYVTTQLRAKRPMSHPAALARSFLLPCLGIVVGFWMVGFDLYRWNVLFWWPLRVLWLGIPWGRVMDLWRGFAYYTYSPNPDAASLYAATCWTYSAEYLAIAALGLLLIRKTQLAPLRWAGRILNIAGWATFAALLITGLTSIAAGILHR
jgi:hypothetical protein